MTDEVWRPVVGYEGFYEISTFGRVKRVRTNFKHENRPHNESYERILRPETSKDGYLRVDLSANGIARHKQVHRLVAEAFIQNPNNFPMINHKDEDRKNNHVSNLEWCDAKYNNNYGTRKQIGSLHHGAKLTEDDVVFIRNNYRPRSKMFGLGAFANRFGVSKRAIAHVIHNESWKHIL